MKNLKRSKAKSSEAKTPKAKTLKARTPEYLLDQSFLFVFYRQSISVPVHNV